MSRPLVSVVIAAYNGERFLAEAIESVLGQTWDPIELIVVDDASSDGTAALAERYADRLTLLRRHTNGGTATARNDGLAVASGEFFTLLDQDDLMTEDRLEVQVGPLLDDPALDVTIGMEAAFLETGAALPTGLAAPRFSADPGAAAPEAFHPPTAVARTEVFRRFGGFSTEVDYADDLDLLLRMLESELKVEPLPRVVIHRRFHGKNQGLDQARTRRAFALSIKRRIERKRGAAGSP